MSTTQAVAPGTSLNTAVDIVVAPGSAFDRIRRVPAWGWTFVVAALLGMAGAILAEPAIWHAMERSLPAQLAANPQMAKLTPEQQQKQIGMVMSFTKITVQFSWLFVPFMMLIASGLQALVMLIASRAGRASGSYKQYFALSIAVAIVGTGLYEIVLGTIAVLRGANAFEDVGAVQSLVPSLAMLVPGAHGALAGFLAAFNVFYLWATALLALGMMRIGRVPRGVAWGSAVVMLLLAAAFLAYSGRQQG